MNEDLLIGLAATAVPLLALGFVFLRRNPAILRFFIALTLVGLGYLGVTGALGDIGRMVQGEASPVVQPVVAPAPVETQPAPPPAVEPPAADPEPEPLPPGDTPVGEPSPPAVETTPEELAPEPEASPPPAEAPPGEGGTQPDALPPANP